MTVDALALVCLCLTMGMLVIAGCNVALWPSVTTRRVARPGSVSVLIPARDESPTILGCLESVVVQGAIVGEVLVYDDRSTDDTAARVEEFRRRDPRVRVVPGLELPPGWCGKPHACQRLAEQARGEWLLFLDADARLRRDAVSRLIAEAEQRRLTLLSAWPSLELVSLPERLLMPLLNLVVFTLFPAPLSLVRNDPALGLAHGACLLVRGDRYRELGGHGLVRAELFEDSRLAQAWRRSGERGLCLDGASVVDVRMYSSLGEIWRGFQKNFYPAFKHEVNFWGFLGLHAASFVVPVVLVAIAPTAVSAAAFASGVAVRLLLAARFGHPLWSTLLHPLATVVMIGIAVTSRSRYRARSGVEWKGRRYGRRGELV